MNTRYVLITMLIVGNGYVHAGKGGNCNKPKRASLRSSQEKEVTLNAEFYRRLKSKKKKSGLTEDEAALLAFMKSKHTEMGTGQNLAPNPDYDIPLSDSEDEAQK